MSGSPFFGRPRPLVGNDPPPFPLARATVALRGYGVTLEEIFTRSTVTLVCEARFAVWTVLADAGWTAQDIARAFVRDTDAVRAKLVERGTLGRTRGLS